MWEELVTEVSPALPPAMGELYQGNCASICASACGDGSLVGGEGCDDGNVAGGDGYSSSCSVEAGWLCSGGSLTAASICASVCGDGSLVGAEGKTNIVPLIRNQHLFEIYFVHQPTCGIAHPHRSERTAVKRATVTTVATSDVGPIHRV